MEQQLYLSPTKVKKQKTIDEIYSNYLKVKANPENSVEEFKNQMAIKYGVCKLTIERYLRKKKKEQV